MSVKPIPQGYTTVTPWIISRDTVQLIAYMKRAFDAEELACLTSENGSVAHAEVRIGDSVVMLFDARPEWPPTPGFLRLYVEDADAVHRQAVAAGGTSVTEATHLFSCTGAAGAPAFAALADSSCSVAAGSSGAGTVRSVLRP
ncbi:VOC family protein [Streptomyces sp. NBC_01237]|uniref:VOC family protein n=1 Tax=Streptomyces sp. NBC_01237 TaxID=2903790 RepID=UPI002DDA86C6|nr:VOC family protein [Streptomyces sp. NBC_01237]WRZ78699.1 VOC family protein [Streptomyces sp. NBC_01237]